jgi:hypothetical protein
MSVEATQNNNEQPIAQKQPDQEINFAKQRHMYEKMLEKEREEKLGMQKQLQEFQQKRPVAVDDDDEDEPYVDKRRLDKKLSQFEAHLDEKIDKKAEQKARMMIDKEREQMWLKNNPDFYEVMGHAQKFADSDPELAETILNMPEGFERQKLVYKNIKALGLHKKEEPRPTMQETIEKNKRSPYYQPTGQGAPPYAAMGDFSPEGMKTAHKKMQELKAKMRL